VELLSFLEAVSRWAESRDDVVGLALIGSHARNAARPDSDIDLTVLCESLEALVNDQDWAALFGEIREIGTERYGRTCSVRVFYENGLEVEFGIAEISWAKIPLDSGTRRVISDGIRILYDPIGFLEEAKNAAAGALLFPNRRRQYR